MSKIEVFLQNGETDKICAENAKVDIEKMGDDAISIIIHTPKEEMSLVAYLGKKTVKGADGSQFRPIKLMISERTEKNL